ncbi:hypothetical protein F5J12DRAFT_383037 [Pisolithus orientalis]|uniref:uncharacterized protein n=1 Tax=Pisolithus orientalis TaxID=936130 RepID=UPI0022246A26|nr:uncharacterized protein F5J12DRAFT_383037 [Pisolithus orientalis]KAI6028508.1 hypothetical protein F5J12DRAFT_383037 [Pisolithus orientalis]
MMPTVDDVEQYFETVERLVSDSLTTASLDLPNIREAINRLWVDITRYGPPFPEIHAGRLGPFELPAPPPPPPPPPKSLIEKTGDWLKDHPWIVSGLVLSTLGISLVAGCRVISAKHTFRRRIKPTTTVSEKRQVVVVLGSDHPLALPLILELEKKGYIVIASVSSAEAVGPLEARGHGFVRALVLDPNEPTTIPVFLRSLGSTLSRRFPISAAGDPYLPSPSHPLLHSVISLLTMSASSTSCGPAPLEQVSLHDTYLPYLLSTHIAPLQTLQALLPLLRADAQRTHASRSIIICLPAVDARIGLPFSSVRAMSAAATVRAADVLRREISAAQGMGRIRVVTVDVGAVGQTPDESTTPPTTDDWTPSEKATYGAALYALSETAKTRTPEDVSKFVDSIIGVVSSGTKTTGASRAVYGVGVGLAYEKLKDWIRGNRFSIGAGAGTYTFASFLPTRLLDCLLGLPHILVGIRNGLLPSHLPANVTSPAADVVKTASANVSAPPDPRLPLTISPQYSRTETAVQRGGDEHETASNADSESVGTDTESSSVESSWISLGPGESSS